MKVVADEKSDGDKALGVATLSSTGALQFGVASEKATGGTVTDHGKAYNFDVKAKAEVSGKSVDYQQGTLTNAADFTMTGETVTIGEDVAFANTGVLRLAATASSDPTVTLNAAYDATDVANSGGKLIITGAAVLGADVTAKSIKIGAVNADLTKETSDVILTNGGKIEAGKTVDTDALTFADKNGELTVNGTLVSDKTIVAASGAQLTVATTEIKTPATASLGAVVVETAATDADVHTFTLTNNTDAAVTATSLTVNPDVAEDKTNKVDAAYAGEFKLASGNFTVGTLNVGVGGTVAITNTNASKVSTLTVNASGASTNNGTINLGSSGKMVVAAGVELTNGKDAVIGADSSTGTAQGTLEVSGTVRNHYKAATTDPTADAENGYLKVAALNIKNGGLVVSELNEGYGVTTTTLEEGGKLQTSLNGKLQASSDKSNNALALIGTFNLKGGSIVDANDAQIKDFILGTDVTLNVQSSYNDLGTVQLNGASGSALNVEGDSTIAALDVQKGAVTVDNDSTLIVTNLKTATGTTVTVKDGELSASLAALGLKLDNKSFVQSGTSKNVEANTLVLEANGTLAVTGLTSADTVDLTDVLTELSVKTGAKGLVHLGGATLVKGDTAIDTTKDVEYNTIAGFTSDSLQLATIVKVPETITQSGDYGKMKLADGKKSLTIDGVSLTLNGDGQLVSYDEKVSGATVNKLADVSLSGAASLIVAGTSNAEAVLGSVTTANDGDKTEFGVEDARNVTVKGDVEVNELWTDKDASLTIVKKDGAETAPEVTVGKLFVDGALVAADSTVTVTNTGTYFDASSAKYDKETSEIAGSTTVKGLNTKGDLLVTGNAKVTGDLEATGKIVYVGNNASAGALSVGNLKTGVIFADPAWDVEGATHSSVAVKTAAEGTLVEAGRNSIVALGTDSTEKAASYVNGAKAGFIGFTLAETPTSGEDEVSAYDTLTVNSVLYVDGGKAEGQDAVTYVGGAAANDKTIETREPTTSRTNSVVVAENSMLVIDLNTVDTTGATAVFDKAVTLEGGSIVYLDNVANGQTVKVSATKLDDRGADVVFEGDLLMDVVQGEGAAANTVTVEMFNKAEFQDEFGDVAGLDAAYGMFEEGKNLNNNSSSAQFNKWLYSSANALTSVQGTDGRYNSPTALRTIANDVASLGATTGVQTLTMDAVNQMADTVATRNSILTQRAQGVNVWVDVNGGKFEAKKLFDGAGYSSDIYSGVLGLDYQFSCNAVLGAALTIGTADTDSKNSGVAASTDTDLVGFSVYASKTFADIWNVAADIGYMSASNDVKANGYKHAWKFSQDTDAFTAGVRGEVLTKAGAVNIVPHVGLRYTQLSTDGFEAGYVTDIDDQNIFQMPVGVALSTDFETNGWTLAPKLDLSVVPTFGDKDADLKLGINGVSATDDLSVRVIDSNPVQATLGINATNGDWGFGLSYKLGVGSDERMNNSFNAQVRYAF